MPREVFLRYATLFFFVFYPTCYTLIYEFPDSPYLASSLQYIDSGFSYSIISCLFYNWGMSLVYILVIVLSTVLMPYLARSVSSSGSCCKSSGLSGQHCVQLQLRLVPFIVSGESVRSTPPRSVINVNNRVPYCIFGHSNDYKH